MLIFLMIYYSVCLSIEGNQFHHVFTVVIFVILNTTLLLAQMTPFCNLEKATFPQYTVLSSARK